MTKKFTKIELKHLKYKMITEKGLTPDEAGKEIDKLIKFEDELYDNLKKEKRKEAMKPKITKFNYPT